MERDRLFGVASGIFLLSVGVLAYEIALTRIFSVALAYHYVFLALSLAMLGVSAGGVFDYLRTCRMRQRGRPEPALFTWASLGGLAMTGSILAVTRLGVADTLPLLTAAAFVPFFCAGVTLAAAFRRFADDSSVLYAADLAGAALGAAIVVWALNTTGGVSTVLTAAVIAAAGGVCLAFDAPRRSLAVAVATAVLVGTVLVLVAGVGGSMVGEVPVGRDPEKDEARLLQDPWLGGAIVERRWSAFGRTDLVRFERDPDSMLLFVDGAAGTSMFRWNGRFDNDNDAGPVGRLMTTFPGAFPLSLLGSDQKDDGLVIGPGGGRDVLLMLQAGVTRITAVEVNPDLVALVEDYAWYNGGIYSRFDNVRIVVDEGRHFLRRSTDRYDLIMLTLPVTKSSRSAEGYALTENFLFTKESIRDYLAHLSPEGRLVVVGHDLAESIKLLVTALEALREQGKPAPEAMKQLYILGHTAMPVVVLQAQPLDRATAARVHQGLHAAGFDGTTSYVPYAEQTAVRVRVAEAIDVEWFMMNQNLIDLATGKIDVADLVRAIPLSMEPASDDRPFFFRFEPGLPDVVTGLFWLSAAVLAVAFLAPAARRRHHEAAPPWRILFLVAGIGAGFMTVEVAIFQRLVLYLGHPTFALALLLFSLLVGTGLGSLTSSRISGRCLTRTLWMAALGSAAGVLLASTLLTPLFERLAGDWTPAVAAALLLVGLGAVMGMPFPLALRLLAQRGLADDVPWAWGVNGAASVFGATLAVTVALAAGYSWALGLAVLLYGSAGLAVAVRRGRPPGPTGRIPDGVTRLVHG